MPKKRRKADKTKRKVNRSKSTPKNVPKKRKRSRSRTLSSGIRRTKKGFGGILRSGVVGKVVQGIGAASLATLVLNRVAPQFAPIGGVAAGFLGGGLVGGAVNLFLSGGLANLGGLFGGQANGGGGEAV